MAKLGFITLEQLEQARTVEVAVKERSQNFLAPHLKETLRQFLEDLYGKSVLYSGGLKIQTTLNRTVQEQAQKDEKAGQEQAPPQALAKPLSSRPPPSPPPLVVPLL